MNTIETEEWAQKSAFSYPGVPCRYLHHKVDVFAFGVLLVELWSSVEPFAGVKELAIADLVKRGQRPEIDPSLVPAKDPIEPYSERYLGWGGGW